MRLCRHVVAVMVVVLSACRAHGQPLIDRVPADAVLYIGWQGTQAMPGGYEKSHLKGLLDASNIPQAFRDTLPQVIARLEQQNKEGAEKLKMLMAVSSPIWRHPCAIYSSGVEFAGFPRPKVGLICQAGSDGDALLKALEQAAANVQGIPIPVKAFRQGDLVGLIVGYEQESAALAGGNGPKSITTAPGFAKAIAQVQKDPMAMVYVDVEGLVAQVEVLLQIAPDPNAKVMWEKVRDATGLGGTKQLALTAGFEGADWSVRGFLAAPTPRVGLLKMLDNPPVSDQTLKSIPKTATMMGVGHFNVAQFVNELREIAGKIDPQAQRNFDMGLGAAQMALAMDLRKGLLEPLGDEWAFYADPNVSGNGLLGIVAINRLKDAAAAQRGLSRLELFLDNTINGQLQQKKLQVRFETMKAGGTTIHFTSVPVVCPSWAIKDGMLYVALYPQVVAAAIDAEATKDGSILDNPDFQALRARLGVKNASGISFMDLPRTAGDMYQVLLAGSQALAGGADLIGAKAPPMMIPPLGTLRKHLSPSGGATWVDEAGWHMKHVSPFPGSEIVASQNGMTAGLAALGSAVLIPALHKARSAADRTASMSNLKQIGTGCMLFANDHPGKYPPDLGVLHMEDDLPVEVFVLPDNRGKVPANLMASKPEERAAWINRNADYVYLGADLKPSDAPDKVLAYEKGGTNGGMSVLFNDGHVAWMGLADLEAAIARQKAN